MDYSHDSSSDNGSDQNTNSDTDNSTSVDEEINMDYSHDSSSDNGSDQNPDSDTDNSMSVEEVLAWIRHEQIPDSNGELIDVYEYYGDLTCEDIVNRTTDSDLQEIIADLLQEDIENNDNDRLDLIIELVDTADITIDDGDLLNEALEQAVKNDMQEAIKFFITQGADEEMGINAAIIADSEEMLEFLGAQTTDDYVKKAVKNKCFGAMGYFLKEDFNTSSEIILSKATKTSNEELVEVVCENAGLDQVYDLIKYLVREGGEELIYVFIDHFDVDRLLTEVQEQDGNKGYYNLVLNHAKKYLQQTERGNSEMDQLFSKFNKLNIYSGILSYPVEKFNGDSTLKKIRNELSESLQLNEENRFAANFIGTTFSTVNHYLTKTPYHQSAREKSETYFRSAQHPFSVFVTPEKARYSPHESLPESKAKMEYGGAANVGLYKPPLDSLNDAKSVKGSEKKRGNKLVDIRGQGKLYDNFLYYKRRICRYIIDKTSFNDKNAVKVGFYHSYPCIMVWIKKPESAPKRVTKSALNAWTEAIISYFIGIVNYTAQRNGLNIELVRRSSFGFLTPTVAPCDQSIRINIGVIPIVYADLLIECLKNLNAALNILNKVSNYPELNIDLPNDFFMSKPEYSSYKGNENVPDVKNILQLIWAKVEKGRSGRVTIQNLVRTSSARDALSAQVYNTLSTNQQMESTQILLSMLRFGFSKIHVTRSGLRCRLGEEKYDMVPLQKAAIPIEDNEFFKFINFILRTIRKEQKYFEPIDSIDKAEKGAQAVIESCIKEKHLQGLYYNLEMLSELLYSRTLLTEDSIIDKFGSDSEVEDNTSKQKIFGKKIIARNGIRAILASLHAGANYLYPSYLTDSGRYPVVLHGAYYETADAARLLAKFEQVDISSKDHDPKILIYDINACIKEGAELPAISREHLSKIIVLIIDSTSATINQYRNCVKKFKQQKNTRILFFVSSGFKNEQMGSDKNPYGTIRIFTKDKKLLSKLIDFIKKVEEPIKSSIAHQYRRMMKRLGNIPINKTIIQYKQSSSIQSNSINYLPEGTELIIPSDGSCLFWSVALGILGRVLDDSLAYRNSFRELFVLEAEDIELFTQYAEGLKKRIKVFLTENRTSLLIEKQGNRNIFYNLINYHFRQKVANYIENHPEIYTASMLGKNTRDEYITYIRDPKSWGGQIEIHAIFNMLGENYQIEVEGANGSNFMAIGKPVIRLVYTNAGGDHAGDQNHYNLRMFPISQQIAASQIITAPKEATIERQILNSSPPRYSPRFSFSNETQLSKSNIQDDSRQSGSKQQKSYSSR